MGVEVAKGDAGVAVCMQGRKELIKERHFVGKTIRGRVHGAPERRVRGGEVFTGAGENLVVERRGEDAVRGVVYI